MAKLTKADIIRSSIAFHLRGVKLNVGKRYLKPELTEEQRYEIADKTIKNMREHGGWKELDDELPPAPFLTGPSKKPGPDGDGSLS
jgi:hypothetical protein